MSLNIETGTNLKYIDETGTYYFHEGDKVICHVGEQIYVGMLAWIGIYKIQNHNRRFTLTHGKAGQECRGKWSC